MYLWMNSYHHVLTRWGGGLDYGSDNPGSGHTLTALGPSDGKEVKDVFERLYAIVRVVSTC